MQSPRVEPQLLLKGISGSKSHPLALINNVTIAPGEIADVRHGKETTKIRCIEIRERSALVEIVPTAEMKELSLREGI